MVGTEFIDYIKQFQLTTYAGVEDFSDKFNFLATVIVLSLCTLIVTVKQYIMKPISCYIATELGGSNLLDYVENYCWVQGTTPLSHKGLMPSSPDNWKAMNKQKILYYQWVPFVLGLQCILFYIPRIIWQFFCFNRTGTNLENIISKAVDAMNANADDRKGIVKDLCSIVELLIFQEHKKLNLKYPNSESSCKKPLVNSQHEFDCQDNAQLVRRKSKKFNVFSEHKGISIVTIYLLIKLLYLINAIGQMCLMQAFLGESGLFGIDVLMNMINGHDWEMTLIFPRVGFCFARMELLGSRSSGVTAQCVLPVNMLNEKIYVFLWWWILTAVVVTFISLNLWIFRAVNCSREANYIRKYIRLADSQLEHDTHDEEIFAKEFLRRDGMFLLRMVRLNAGDVVAVAMINHLWKSFLNLVGAIKCDAFTNKHLTPKSPFNDDISYTDADKRENEFKQEVPYPIIDELPNEQPAMPKQFINSSNV